MPQTAPRHPRALAQREGGGLAAAAEGAREARDDSREVIWVLVDVLVREAGRSEEEEEEEMKEEARSLVSSQRGRSGGSCAHGGEAAARWRQSSHFVGLNWISALKRQTPGRMVTALTSWHDMTASSLAAHTGSRAKTPPDGGQQAWL